MGHKAIDKDDTKRCIAKTGDVSYTTHSDDEGFKVGI